jgi:thioredoxin reductase (NADPH)
MKKTKEWDVDCAIIGGGPGGLACALYLLRFKRDVVLFQTGTPRVRWAPKIHNFLGHPDGVTGTELLKDFKRQLKAYPDFRMIEREAHVSRHKNGFLITDSSGKNYRAKKVVLATGVADVQPEIKNLDPLRKSGYLRYCSICDGYEMCKQPVAVLAKDDYGIQKALYICTWTHELKVFVPVHYQPAPRIRREIERMGLQLVPCSDMSIHISPDKRGLLIREADEDFFATVLY